MGRQQIRLLKFALDYPGWHTMGSNSPNERRAMERLAAKGLIEVKWWKRSPPQFRIRQPQYIAAVA